MDKPLGLDPLDGFFEALAAPTATPGAGSVVAAMGAMAAALVAMVCGLTLGKAEAPEAGLQQTLRRAHTARASLGELQAEDVRAFDAVMAAYALPRESEAQRAARSHAIQAALQAATLVPLACARACGEVLELTAVAVRAGHANLSGEAAVAVLAAQAGLRGAALTVRLNAAGIKDRSFAEARLAELGRIMQRYDGLAAALLEKHA